MDWIAVRKERALLNNNAVDAVHCSHLSVLWPTGDWQTSRRWGEHQGLVLETACSPYSWRIVLPLYPLSSCAFPLLFLPFAFFTFLLYRQAFLLS